MSVQKLMEHLANGEGPPTRTPTKLEALLAEQGSNIHRLMEETGMSSSFYACARGEKRPKPKTIQKVAEYLNLSVEEAQTLFVPSAAAVPVAPAPLPMQPVPMQPVPPAQGLAVQLQQAQPDGSVRLVLHIDRVMPLSIAARLLTLLTEGDN